MISEENTKLHLETEELKKQVGDSAAAKTKMQQQIEELNEDAQM